MNKFYIVIFIYLGIFISNTSFAQMGTFSGPIYNPPVSSQMSFSAISANTGTSVQQAIANVSDFEFYNNTPRSIYSGTTSTGLPWTSCPTCEVSLATFTIPGGQMGANGYLDYDYEASATSGSNSKTMKFTVFGVATSWKVVTTSGSFQDGNRVKNRNSESSQIAHYQSVYRYGTSGNQPHSMTANTGIDQSVVISAITSIESGQTPTSSSSGNGMVCTATILPSHGYNTGEYIQAAGGSNCSTSGSPNADPVIITRLSESQFTYPCTCNGNMVSTFPTMKRYSVIQLESVDGVVRHRN